MNLHLKYKLKSGALQFAIFIGILIALLLSALMLYAYSFNYMNEQSKGAIENIRFSDIAIANLLEESTVSTDTVTLATEKENQSVKTNLSYWGVYEKAYASAQYRKKRFEKIALLGSKIITKIAPTLYLLDNYSPLTIVGNTTLKGNIYVTSQGIKPGYIAGESYFGNQLFYGTLKNSDNHLPEVDKKCLDNIKFYLNEFKPFRDGNTVLKNTYKTVNSFHQKIKGAYSKSVIVLENIQLSGNIIIKSDTLIRVKKTALLKDLILIAPTVIIEDDVSGNFQVIASAKINLGKHCALTYPSALVLYHDNKDRKYNQLPSLHNNQIFIDEGSSFAGSICYLQENAQNDFDTEVLLEKQVRLKGDVYCQGNLELKGTVSGSVITKQFIANQSGTIFLNHIYNGTIENEHIPDFYGGLFFTNENKTVMQWLY